MDVLTKNRSKIIREQDYELFAKEKEFNSFMHKYFTECQNIVSCETVLSNLKEFQDKMLKEVKRLTKDHKKVELHDHINQNIVSN